MGEGERGEMEAMLPCWRCGKVSAFVERQDFVSAFVQCDCGIRGPVMCQDGDDEETPGEAAAIRAWNERVEPADLATLRAERDRLKEALEKISQGTPAEAVDWGRHGTDNHDDIEQWGYDVAHSHFGKIAREALASAGLAKPEGATP